MGIVSFGILFLHLVKYRVEGDKKNTMQIWSGFMSGISVVAFFVLLLPTIERGDQTTGFFSVLTNWLANNQGVSMSIALSLLFVLIISIVMASIHSFYMAQQKTRRGASILLAVAAIEVIVFTFGLAWSAYCPSKEYMTHDEEDYFIVYSDRDAYYGCLIKEMDEGAIYVDMNCKIVLDIDGVQRIKLNNNMALRLAREISESNNQP